MDLLWFPTGGGKTEAYLGLVAYTGFLRRLREPWSGGGMACLMRYTLRLLTIQQFRRATALICACEVIRREHSEISSAPFSVGLWVGQGATPNKLDDARRALSQLAKGRDVEEGNPVQLDHCPWCDEPLSHVNYRVDTRRKRLVIRCPGASCDFREGIPAVVVDSEIYDEVPTLLIATADKFAALPWREETGNLFNHASGSSPPDLVVQDELHLISGPLGTLVGLYESAIDELCRGESGARSKVVASTATIRRAGAQTLGLFDRAVAQFPPPGLDAADSYFAVTMGRNEKASRLYVGLMAPGSSHTTLLVRVYATLLQYASHLDVSDDVRDPYWTLLGYFNSLRVLGGASLQCQDDVIDRMEVLAKWSGTMARMIRRQSELTSRKNASEVRDALTAMEETVSHGQAVDIILATNMISVGLDVPRLALMAVMGQPQSASEYIQATSRVGRRYPGLVCVLLNAARSRDRSHYESFRAFHGALYRQVEATSVTPFSARARDRGLHAVVVALSRNLVPELRANDAASAIVHERAKVEAAVTGLLARVRSCMPEEEPETRAAISEILDEWEHRARACPDLVYENWREPEKALLVNASSPDADQFGWFPTLWSLRDVDTESVLQLMEMPDAS